MIMAERAGIPVVPHLINGVMVIATLSVGTIDIYVTVYPTYSRVNEAEQSRCLFAMSYLEFTGNETRILTQLLRRKSRLGVPWVGVWLSTILGLFAFMVVGPDPSTGFQNVCLF